MKVLFEDTFQQNSIKQVVYKQWLQIDNDVMTINVSLKLKTKRTGEFLDCLFDILLKLLKHSFIATKQSSNLRHKKEIYPWFNALLFGILQEIISLCFKTPLNAWNNAQATLSRLYLFVIYYTEDGVLEHNLSLVIISDCMAHDTVTV